MKLVSMVKITYLRNYFIMKRLWWSKVLIGIYAKSYKELILKTLQSIKEMPWYEQDKEMKFSKLTK